MMAANMCFSFAVLHFSLQVCAAVSGHLARTSCPRACTAAIAFNMVDGVIRMAIFLGFLYVISRMKDIRRVFEYHGAEHKVVFNFESGKPVTVENAQTFITFHPRCGTSFLLVVMVISMIVLHASCRSTFVAKLAGAHPAAAGDHRVSYELIRFAAKRRGPDGHPDQRPGCGCSGSRPSRRRTIRPQSRSMRLEHAMALEKAQGGELVIA